MKKRGGKTEDLINKKPPKLDEETRRKTDHLFVEGEKLPKPSQENGEENQMLID